MSQPRPTKTNAQWPGTRFAEAGKRGYFAWFCSLMLGATVLASCSDDQPRRENSELPADPAAAAEPNEATLPDVAPDHAPEQPTGPLSGVGNRYRVVVGTAYFFDQPEQSAPNGRYLRRGDAFYGEGETNGFVKTSFVQPNGASGTAWLKVQELSKLAGGNTRTVQPLAPVHSPATPAAAASSSPNEATSPAAPLNPGVSAPGAVVQVNRAYFYTTPDLVAPRKAFCQRGDKVRLGEARGDAVYVTFTNWEKVTTTGWMRKADLGAAN